MDQSAAVGAVLLLRAMALAVSLAIGLLTLAALPDVTRAVLGRRSRPLVLPPYLPDDEPETCTIDTDLARAS